MHRRYSTLVPRDLGGVVWLTTTEELLAVDIETCGLNAWANVDISSARELSPSLMQYRKFWRIIAAFVVS